MVKPHSERAKWDEIHERKFRLNSYNKYPTEHIVIFMAQNYYKVPNRKKIRVLEIGCGSGNNLVYLANEGFQPYGIDYSAHAVRMAKKFLADNHSFARVYYSCASSLPFNNNFFDVCVESNAIHCNTWRDIKCIFDEIYRVLKPRGRFFGILACDKCAEYGSGRRIKKNTFDFTNTRTFRGQFDGFPTVHFFTKEEIKSVAGKFTDLQLELNLTTFESGRNKSPIAYWLLALKK